MQRKSRIIGALSIVFIIASCASLRRSNEEFYYRETLWTLIQLPEQTKSKCQYDYEVPYPAFIESEDIATDFDTDLEIDNNIPIEERKSRPNLEHGIVINYNPAQMEHIRHESVHYLNRMKRSQMNYMKPNGVTAYEKVSWECLDELSAHFIEENLRLRDRLGIQMERTSYWQRKAYNH